MSLIIKQASFEHLSDDELAQWRDIPTAVISDDLNRSNTMHAAIKPLSLGQSFAGQALPVQTMVGDNGTLHYALASAWQGCILVVDARGHTETAVWGGVLTGAAEAKGVTAVVIDGALRDAAELRAAKLIAYSRAIVPNGPHKGFGGSVNTTIQCAGVTVSPGDLIVGDDDGVVVIPLENLPGLMDKCKARLAKEEKFMEKIASGVSTVELMGLPPVEDIG